MAKRGDVIQEVSATGKVKPSESVNLAFEKGGRVASINVGVGDRVFAGQKLVILDSSELMAQLAEAEANVKTQEAKLEELRLGTRPEEIDITEAKVREAKESLVDKLKDAYTKSDDAVRNKADQFITDSRTSSPKLNFGVTDSSLKSEVEAARFTLEGLLVSWKSSLDGLLYSSDTRQHVETAKANLVKVRDFLDKVALAINNATPNITISQTILDSYRADVATARTNVNTAINNVSSGETNLVVKEKELLLKESGTLPEQITAQEAQVLQVRAKADNVRAQIVKTGIYSPIKGVVTRQDAKVGEIIIAGAALVSVISDAEFEIESNIPEVDIVKIKVGNDAKVTLDAYGNDVEFLAKVIAIDPAETVIEGVATYKVTLGFSGNDGRIKSGMTANIDILSEKKESVIFIPLRAVITRNGNKIVKVFENGDVKEVEVKTGLKGSDGNVEIMEGLKEGDHAVISSGEK